MDEDTFNQSEENKEIIFNFDSSEVDLDNMDNLDFRPVTKGLGFHNEEIRRTPLTKKIIHDQNLKSIPERSPGISRKIETKTRDRVPLPSISGMGSFYDKVPAKEISKKRGKKKKVFEEANSYIQFIAWLVDILFVSFFVTLTAGSLILVSGIEYKLLLRAVEVSDIAVFLAAIFSTYYLTYFTIFDLSISPGKFLCNIRLVDASGKSTTPKNTLIRALVTLVSLPIFGLPSILDFQGKLSDSVVVKIDA